MPNTAKTLLEVPTPSHWVTRYALSCAIVAAATLVRALVDPLIHDQIPYFIYVASVVVATWFCGLGGGILGTLLAGFAGNYFFVPPRYEVVPHGEDWTALAMFVTVGLGLVWFVNRWRTAEHGLRKHADELAVLHGEAERANRLKDEFLATLSHELRTPLNAVLGWAQILEAGRLDAGQQKRALEAIVRNAKAQTRLVEDILDVSAIVSGKLVLHPATIDLSAIVGSAIEVFRPEAEAKGIGLRASFTPNAVMVGDPDRVRQVASNLLSNAVKFSDEGGIVDVRIDRQDSRLALTVSDTGRGIDPAFLPHVFERFRQADGSTTRERGGLGLGLAIVRHLVELHGGTVAAESRGVNRGATFTAVFPVRAVAGMQSRDAQPEARREMGTVSLAGVRVLVVDDEADARELVALVLGEFGAEVQVASSAGEAYRELRRWRPDVLVADIGMPVEDGYSLLRRVRALAPDQGGAIPAAALTAYAQTADRALAQAAGFQEHVAKPVQAHELARLVSRLARTQPQSAN